MKPLDGLHDARERRQVEALLFRVDQRRGADLEHLREGRAVRGGGRRGARQKTRPGRSDAALSRISSFSTAWRRGRGAGGRVRRAAAPPPRTHPRLLLWHRRDRRTRAVPTCSAEAGKGREGRREVHPDLEYQPGGSLFGRNRAVRRAVSIRSPTPALSRATEIFRPLERTTICPGGQAAENVVGGSCVTFGIVTAAV
eukprot:366559-Chlamydomonas_euryale.AAC.8